MSFPLKRWLAVAVLLVVFAIFLRVVAISRESLDGDELFSVRVAESAPAKALALIKQDLVHPPLYYFVLKAALPKGRPTPLEIRDVSLAAGAACIAVVVLIGAVIPPLSGPAMLAAFLLALNKLHIFYSQEARSYALFCLLGAILVLWSLLMDRYGERWSYWGTGAGLMLVLVYTHYFGGIYCAAAVAPVVTTRSARRFRIRALLCLAFAALAFVPWAFEEIPVYHHKSGIDVNLAWQGVPSLYDLKMSFADYLGVPPLPGFTTLVFLIGAVLVAVALFSRCSNERKCLDRRQRVTLGLMLVAPPLIGFVLSRSPFNLPIFGERHILPSVVPGLLLVCYGVWQLAWRLPRKLHAPALVGATCALALLQAAPLWGNRHEPFRQPYQEIAARLKTADAGLPVYTTWPYGAGQSVAYYLDGRERINEIPRDMSKLPDKFIVLYRPAMQRENAVVQKLLSRFDIVESKYYAVGGSEWGTRVVVLQTDDRGRASLRQE
jgi:uncharacterized membrane protein